MSRGWLIAGGILSIFVGFLAMGSPLLFSIVIAQFLGAFAIVSGVISLFLALFGKEVTHRILEAFFALIRIAAGLALFICVASSIAVITLIFAVFLIVEGIFLIGGALRLRKHKRMELDPDQWNRRAHSRRDGVFAMAIGLYLGAGTFLRHQLAF